jgi:hypothetical protein
MKGRIKDCSVSETEYVYVYDRFTGVTFMTKVTIMYEF